MQVFIIGEMNINSLDYETCKLVINYFNILFKFLMLTVITISKIIKKKHTSIAMDCTLTNVILPTNI